MKIHELRGAADLARQLREAVQVATKDKTGQPMTSKCMVGSIDAALLAAVDGLDALVLYLEELAGSN